MTLHNDPPLRPMGENSRCPRCGKSVAYLYVVERELLGESLMCDECQHEVMYDSTYPVIRVMIPESTMFSDVTF